MLNLRVSIATTVLVLGGFLWSCNDQGTNMLSSSIDFRIAYFTDQFDTLRMVTADGTRDVGITSFNTRGVSADWFPNNPMLVFSESNGDSTSIWVMNVRTGSKHLLFAIARASIHNLNVAPNGQQIACTIYYWNNTGSQLFVFDADGTNQRAITPIDRFVWWIQWSPTSSRIIFSLEHKICEICPDGSNFRQLQTDSARAFQPTYSPDGTKICYSLSNGTATAICVMRADGSDPHLITPFDSFYKGSPQWSPDGLAIAYVQDDSQHVARVFTMTSSGQNSKQLSVTPGVHFDPHWIPDGRIVFFSNSTMDLWIVDRNGTQTPRLTYIPPEKRGGNLTFAVSKTAIP